MATSAPEAARSTDDETGRSLGLWPLVGLIIGSMIGAGIFNLPSQIAGTARSGPMLLGWLVFGVGMLFIALTFSNLGTHAPEVDGGVYGYATDGFGRYMGFGTAWGYWFSTWTGSVSYLVLLFAALGHYFPAFEGGNTRWAILGASVVLWAVHALILMGIKNATFVNMIVSAAKVVPLIAFVLLALFAFKQGVFTADFWGKVSQVAGDGDEMVGLGSTGTQIKGMMGLLVWFFLGIESTSIYAARARKRSDASKATIIGFGTVLFLLVAVNVLAFGISTHDELTGYADPSLSDVLAKAVGGWGSHLILIGVMVSLVGGYLSWMLLSSEILMYPGKDANLPRVFGRENRHGVPVTGLWLTSICMQLMLLWTLRNSATYTQLSILAGSMVLLPYLWSAIYQVMIAARRRYAYARPGSGRVLHLVLGVIATLFSLFLLWAAGLQYVLFAGLAILVGTVLFVWARLERHEKVFRPYEYAILAIVAGVGVYAAWALATGRIAV